MTAPCPALGFCVVIDVTGDSAVPLDELRRAWTDFLETRGLYCMSTEGRPLTFVVASEASQATETDRAAARTWLTARPELRAWSVGDLEDLRAGDR